MELRKQKKHQKALHRRETPADTKQEGVQSPQVLLSPCTICHANNVFINFRLSFLLLV